MGRMRKQTYVEECSKVIKSLLKYRMKGRLGRTCDERMLPNIKEVIADAQSRAEALELARRPARKQGTYVRGFSCVRI